MPGLGAADAGRLAAELGDLPLAVAQAAGFMAETSTSAAQYLELLRTQAGQLLDQATPGSSYPRSLAAATRLAADRLEDEDPAAAQLANLCALLAPEPIPEDLFTSTPGALPDELAARATDPLGWRQTLGRLTRQSLARIDQRGLVMHRLTQAILRDRLTAGQAAATRACTEAILTAANPRDQANPVTWPQWAQLMPHLLAADLAATDSTELRWMACNACAYLLPAAIVASPATLPRICTGTGGTGSAMTTSTPRRLLSTLPGPCGTWAATPRPASWTRTLWPAATASSAPTTPTPSPRRTTSSTT
jgi:hypothetical protein